MNSIYQINKGINQPIRFKGLQAQYIGYLAAVLLALLVGFAAMYIMGIPSYICVVVVAVLGSYAVAKLYGLSNRYGEHGMTKLLAARGIPKAVKLRSRKVFLTTYQSERLDRRPWKKELYT